MILQQIKDAQLAARKSRDTATATALTTLIGEIAAVAKNARREPTDVDAIKTINKFLAGQNTLLEAAGRIGDQARIAAASAEIALLAGFLPAAKPQLSAEALRRVVRSAIASRIASDCAKPKMGAVIGDVKLLHDGEYDPKALAPLVKAELDSTAEV